MTEEETNNLPAVFSQIDILTDDDLDTLEEEAARKQGRSTTIYPPLPDDFKRNGVSIDYLPSVRMALLASEIIREYDEFSHLRSDVEFACYWKRTGGKSSGKIKLGDCVLTPPLERSLTGSDFTIWIAADHCRTLGLSQEQYWRLLYHQLKHATTDEDTDAFKIKPHDVEAFTDELIRFGPWTTDLEQMVRALENAPESDMQLPLGIKL